MNKLPMRIAIGGSAANPPHLAHRAIVRTLLESGRFDKVVWIVSGARKDKRNLASPFHRVAMTLANLSDLAGIRPGGSELVIDTNGAFGKNKSTITLIEEYELAYPDAEIVWYTGADIFAPRAQFGGRNEVESTWHQGQRLFTKRFLVIERPGYPHLESMGLPKHFEFLEVDDLPPGSSNGIRARIMSGRPFEHLVAQKVAWYIKHYNLYKGVHNHE